MRKQIISMLMSFVLLAVLCVVPQMEVKAAKKGNITITLSGEDAANVADVQINDTPVFGSTVEGNIGSGDKNKIRIVAHPTYEISAIKINGVDVTGQFHITGTPTKDNAVCAAFDAATSYDIEVTAKPTEYHTITWTYDLEVAAILGMDALVENGTVELVSVDGTSVDSKVNNDQLAIVKKGQRVIVKLTPNYGYQISGLTINAVTNLVAQPGISEFEFTMPDTNVHFKGAFSKSSDIVKNNATSFVSKAGIGNGKALADSGNAELQLAPAKMEASVPVLSGGKTVNNVDDTKKIWSLDITTNHVVSKGNGEYWSTPKTDLGSEVEVSMKVGQNATGYAVLRKHNDDTEQISSNYDPATNIVTFGSSKFSTYTLVPLTTENNNYIVKYPMTDDSTTMGADKSDNQSAKKQTGHTHQYEWQTITQVREEQDGLEAYACTICGATQATVPVSAHGYACTEGAKKVLAAEQNATVILDMHMWNAYPRWFMEKLASRRDLTIILQFDYLHKTYEVTIPAGAEVDTTCEWYGPLKLMSLYQWKEV